MEALFRKTLELYEMIVVRHGLMIVGHSFGAKTSMYRILAGALTDLHAKGLMNEQKTRWATGLSEAGVWKLGFEEGFYDSRALRF